VAAASGLAAATAVLVKAVATPEAAVAMELATAAFDEAAAVTAGVEMAVATCEAAVEMELATAAFDEAAAVTDGVAIVAATLAETEAAAEGLLVARPDVVTMFWAAAASVAAAAGSDDTSKDAAWAKSWACVAGSVLAAAAAFKDAAS